MRVLAGMPTIKLARRDPLLGAHHGATGLVLRRLMSLHAAFGGICAIGGVPRTRGPNPSLVATFGLGSLRWCRLGHSSCRVLLRLLLLLGCDKVLLRSVPARQ